MEEKSAVEVSEPKTDIIENKSNESDNKVSFDIETGRKFKNKKSNQSREETKR